MKISFTKNEIKQIKKNFLPCYLYEEAIIKNQIQKCLNFNAPYGLTVRYAMKANSNVSLLNLFHQYSIFFDASSFFEVERAVKGGIPISKILLTSQQIPNFEKFIQYPVIFNACSLYQLEQYGKFFPSTKVGIRINPGLGSGGNVKTNVGGVESSFGIWHENIPEVLKVVKKYQLEIERIHTHIGSGSDPLVWQEVAKISISFLNTFTDAKILNLGGGYKIARQKEQEDADLQKISRGIEKELINFYEKTNRKIHLEIEPGTYLIAKAGFLVAEIEDIVSTKENHFIKLNTGMNDFLRTTLYGENHRIEHISLKEQEEKFKEYTVVGHCCESGDKFTIGIKKKLQDPNVGDFLVIYDCGAYCSSLSAKNYNSFPEIAEYLRKDGELEIIKKRQSLEQIIENEMNIYDKV